jgi:hypothetical protein
MKGGLFDCEQLILYPPFKHGLYMEEYCVQRYTSETAAATERTYIPLKWTNFQLSPMFSAERPAMQRVLNAWVEANPNPHGYFTIAQCDDGPDLTLPPNTIVYGACSGDVQIPLIYEDTTHRLVNMPKKSFHEKTILCSFVGTLTHGVRRKMQQTLSKNPAFRLTCIPSWSINVSADKQSQFIETTINSKFALAPRGYGRASFRFYEIFQLGTIPVYIWDDIEWLPYKDTIDYSKFCVSIHVNDLPRLEELLKAIDETSYNNMLEEYNKIKHMFTYEGMYTYIMERESR